MKHRVKITQVLEGYVDLEADRPEDALSMADDMYRRQGMELPDMDDGLPLQFSLEEILEQSDRTGNKIFLTPGKEQFWSAAMGTHPPDDHAVALVVEGDYPVALYYERLDLNGSGVTDGYICHDQNELLQTLDWIGKCGHTLLEIWDFDIDKPMAEDLCQLLQDTYTQKCKRIQEVEWDQTEAIGDEKKDTTLEERLSAATESAKHPGEPKNPERQEFEH